MTAATPLWPEPRPSEPVREFRFRASRGCKPPECGSGVSSRLALQAGPGVVPESDSGGLHPRLARNRCSLTVAARTRTRPAALALALLALALIGCSTLHQPRPLVDPADPADAPLASPSLPWRIGVLPLVVDDAFTTAAAATNAAPTHRRWAYTPPPEWRREFIEQITDALRTRNCCDEIRFIPGEGRRLDAVLEDAWDDDIDLVIRPVLRTRECSFVEHNGWHVPAAIIWIVLFHFFTFGIADETFASDMVVSLEVFHTGRGSRDPVAVREVAGRVKHELDDLQQGFNFFNVFITPSGLSPGHWEDIGNNLLPLSSRECQRDLLRVAADAENGLAADLRRAGRAMEKSLVVFAGASPPDGTGPRYAATDVTRLHDQLQVGLAQPFAADRAVSLLTGSRATSKQMLDAIDRLIAGRGRAGDRALLVLEMPGYIDADGNGTLLPGGATVEDPAGGLTIAELAAHLANLPEAVLVVAAVDWRVDPGASPGDDDDEHGNPWAPLQRLPGVALVSATSALAPELIDVETSHTSLLIDELVATLAAGAEADADGDGWLSWNEIIAHMQPQISMIAAMNGTPQRVTASGDATIAAMPFIECGPASDTPPAHDPPGPDR